MLLFPSIWDLLLPNFNIFTIIGIVAIILGVLGFVFLRILDKVLPLNIGGTSLILIVIGIVMVWGISMIQDMLGTIGGWIILGMLVIVGLLIMILKGKKGKVIGF